MFGTPDGIDSVLDRREFRARPAASCSTPVEQEAAGCDAGWHITSALASGDILIVWKLDRLGYQ